MIPEVRVFGPLSYFDGDRLLGPRDLGGIKSKQILEILLSARGRTVSKRRLAELLWAGRKPQDVPGAIEHHICLLRKTVGRNTVVTETGGYRLQRQGFTLDLDRFDALLADAARATHVQARRWLREALTYAARGELFEDEPDARWADAIRATYRSRILAAALDAANAALADGDFREVLAYADRCITLDGLLEAAYRLKMLALYGLGQHYEAADTYHTLVQTLDTELGIRPSLATRGVYAAMLRQTPLSQLLPPAPAHAQNPHPGTRFLGRSTELSVVDGAIRKAYTDGEFTLVRVVGDTGSGKTRFLQELAIRQTGRLGMAACSPRLSHLAYVPLATALRQALGRGATWPQLSALGAVFPELAEGSSVPSALSTAEAVVALVQHAGPLVLLIDDLQWADRETLGVLSYLDSRGAPVPAAVIASADQPITGLNWRQTVHLGPLSPGDLARTGKPDLYELTAGRPDLVTAVLNAAGGDDLGRAVLEIAGPDLPTLRAAAVLEAPFDADLVGRITARDPIRVTEELERLCRRGLLAAEGGHFRFRYPPLAEVVRSAMSPAWLRVLASRAKRPSVWSTQSFSKGYRQDAV